MKYDHFTMLPTRAFRAWGAPGRTQMTLEGGGDAPEPDPQVGASQQKLADLAVRQQDWYENNLAPKVLSQMDQSIAISKQQADSAKELQDYQLGLSKQYNDRYWNTQVPLEDELISQAKAYNEPAEQERMAGQAGADVEQAAATGGQALQRGLAMRGINSGSAAAISAMADMRSNADLAKAGAMNKTRQAAKEMGWTKLGEAAALGRGLPSFGSSSAALSAQAGSSALTAGTNGLGSVGTAAGISNSSASSAANLWNQSANVGLGLYQGQLGAYNTQQQATASQYQAAGSLATAGLMFAFASDRRLKTDIERVGFMDNGLPIYRFRYKSGGPFVFGVMADEVEKVKPEAVAKGVFGGYDGVRYDLL